MTDPIATRIKRVIEFTGEDGAGAFTNVATATLDPTGTNNSLLYTSKLLGTEGNDIRVRYVDPAADGAALGVVVSGHDITVNLATDADNAASGTLTSDATNPDAGGTITIGGVTYTFRATLTGAFASAILTSDETNPTEDDTVTVNDRTYRFRDTLALANDVQIGVDADTTLANLRAAINGTGTPGTEYFAGTQAATGVTAGAVTAHAITITANAIGTAGNAFAKAEVSTHLDFDGAGATFTGGVNTVANEILIGAAAADTLDNVKSAVNGTAGGGTTYSTGTVANPTVSATTNADTTQLFVAVTAGAAGNAIVFDESATHLSMDGSGFLTGGDDGGEITSTADDIKTAIAGEAAADALVEVADTAANDGSGVVTALPYATLSGGEDGTAIALFNITGKVLAACWMDCEDPLTGATATIEIGLTSETAVIIPQFVATTLDKREIADKTGVLAPATTPNRTPFITLFDGEQVILTPGTADIDGGKATVYCEYYELTAGATVEAVEA